MSENAAVFPLIFERSVSHIVHIQSPLELYGCGYEKCLWIVVVFMAHPHILREDEARCENQHCIFRVPTHVNLVVSRRIIRRYVADTSEQF